MKMHRFWVPSLAPPKYHKVENLTEFVQGGPLLRTEKWSYI